jgi:hypothetical protein
MEFKINESVLISIIIIFIYFFYRVKNNKLTLVSANDNHKYMVNNDINKEISANLLAELIKNMYILKNHLQKNKTNFPEYSQYIDLLGKNFSEERTTIYENNPESDLTSYSVNKGEEVVFCLKSKKTGEYHNINLLLYVALHEMAHMACPEIGHSELFKKIFKFLTLEAIKIKIYTKVNYNDKPVEYCGMNLSSSIV